MTSGLTGFLIGTAFGASLLLSGLADPDKILGALRLKDFHAIRTIAVFVLVSMVGVWVLDLAGLANFSIKPATIWTVLAGGALLGVGFGMSGYCPGTGLACAAAGRIDALVSVVGMFAGALAFILVHPYVVGPLEATADFGKTTLPEITTSSSTLWVVPIAAIGAVVLWMTRPRKGKPIDQASSPREP